VINPRGYATTSWFQVFDEPSEEHVVQIQAPEGVSVAIARDLFGKPASISRSGAGASATRSYVYDANQRLCKTIEPETGATIQAYDGTGNLTWRAGGLAPGGLTDCDLGSAPEARKVNFAYDARDRLIYTTYGDGSPGVGRAYTPDGLLASIGSGSFVWSLTYNARRLQSAEALSTPQGRFAFGYGIDGYGNTSSMSYPGGPTVGYAPDALGRPTGISGYVSGIGYHPNGHVSGYTAGNGVAHSVAQNLRGLPQLWRDVGVVQDLYTYDANGNVAAIADQQEGLSSRSMAYDGLDRLTSASGIWGAGQFLYDALDNITVSRVGARIESHLHDPATNRLTGLSGTLNIAMAYDANGNFVQRGNQRFAFDIGNRLTAAANVASYAYDGHGRRSWMLSASGRTVMRIYGQGGRLLLTNDSTKGTTWHIHLGDKVVAETNTLGGTRWLHTDALGSPVASTGPSGALIDRTRYEPYGLAAAGINPDGIGFTGHVNDVDTGLVYMQQRYYDPIAGRFLSVDPVTTKAEDGGFFGRYYYANNSPLKYRDPDGQASCVDEQCTVSTIDRFIPRQDGLITLVTFVNDNPAGSSPNQPISTATAKLVESIISKSNVDAVNINSTTGGHSPPSSHSSARAVDINRVEGKPVNSGNGGAARIQESAKSEPGTRENFGPKIMERALTPGGAAVQVTDPKLTAAHQNHVHISSQP
jgi:RHS repeat-associated protein